MTRKNKGFTLVEILIVVIILGILAAIVIPQFTNASEDARASALSSDLQSLRSQIELYKIQHHDRGPNIKADGTEENDSDNFVDRLTGTTDEWGDTTKSGKGPYMQEFPSNPFADAGKKQTVSFAGANPKDAAVAGWWYDPNSGVIEPTVDQDGAYDG
jgi:general secretion pathway protein G